MTDTWREALELAGLETRSKLGGSKKTSIGATELFERCYAAYGSTHGSGGRAFRAAPTISPTTDTPRLREP
jgi:hypothetical protein